MPVSRFWKPIPDWPYSVSNDGRVRNDRTGHVLVPMWTGQKRKQYATVMLCNSGVQWTVKIHHLVLELFVGPRPPGMKALHKDDNTKDNSLGNLYWGTPTDNAVDAALKHSMLTPAQAQDIRRRRAAGEKGAALARQYGVSQQLVCDIYKGRAYHYV